MARKTKEAAAETRRQILDTALDVFSRKGYSRTTFVDIAGQIGLTKGAVYWHFKSKTDLLVALIEENIARKEERILNPEKMAGSLAALRECYVDSARQMLSDPQMRKFDFFINYQIEWSGELMTEVRTRLAQIGRDPFRKYSVAIGKLQDAGQLDRTRDAEKLGSLLIGMWIGMVRLHLMGMISGEDLVYRIECGFDTMFKDIAKKEENHE